MLLENNDIKLRALEPEDLEILYKWENDTELWIHGNTLTPYSKLVLRQYISETQAQDIYQAKQLRLMIVKKSDNIVIGTVDLYDFDPHNSKVGIGILIDSIYRNNNYASKTLEIIEEYVYTFLNINQIYSYIAEDNGSSIRIFEKNGYIKSGTLKNWICCNSKFKNVHIYQRLNEKTVK